MNKIKLATIWFDNCSGCHMSLLDLDERLIDIAGKIELVYGPLVDAKEFPEGVDVTLVEGGIASDEDVRKIRKVRANSRIVVSLGDCAVTGNVPAMRNTYSLDDVFRRAYFENTATKPQRPTTHLPVLLDQVKPIHALVKVDVFVPGCPPPADAIFHVLSELLAGRMPEVSAMTRFGQ